MDISLIHAGLAAGAALAAVPVILHLFMKQTPKRVVFPALRLIRERQKRSRKKLRIKNWLLLLARMALVALMALALARPRLFSQTSLGDQEVPSAVAFVFDTSLSMGYKEKEKTRLDDAKERALDIVKKLPDTSQVFVLESTDLGISPLSPAAAKERISKLALTNTNRSLNAAVTQAYNAVVDCDRPRHEVYILTDLARSSWNTDRKIDGLDKLKSLKSGVTTYVLNLGPKEVHDVSVVDASPSVSVASPGEPVDIRVRLLSRGKTANRTVELKLDNVPRGKQIATLAADVETELHFRTHKLDPSMTLHQGEIRISGTPDPLEFDDVRYFTFKVQPAYTALVVSDRDIDASYVASALDPDPSTVSEGTPRTCQVEAIRTGKLADKTKDMLHSYTAIFVVNVAELSESNWDRLNGYVRDGGGLVVGLGYRCAADDYNQSGPAQLLPAELKKRESPKPETTFGKMTDVSHPLFRRYHKQLEAGLSQVPVYHYWSLKAREGAESRTLLTFANGAPALLERTFRGSRPGHVLLWATPLSRRNDKTLPDAWNEFPNPMVGWSFLAVMNETIPYFAGATSEKLNFEAGEDANLPIDPTRRFKTYTVESLTDKTIAPNTFPAPLTSESLVILAPPALGQWKVTATGAEGSKGTMGFSVNAPTSETRVDRLEKAELEKLFGKDGYSLADDSESLKRAIVTSRVGHEIFPWLMALILLLVTAENLLANRFHRETAPSSTVGAAA
jgi:hypothetical protein